MGAYTIIREAQTGKVNCLTPNGSELRHVVIHSPDGFEAGYGGSGPADLALSILADYFGEHQSTQEAKRFRAPHCPKAWQRHQDFKWAVIAKLKLEPGDYAVITAEEILRLTQE